MPPFLPLHTGEVLHDHSLATGVEIDAKSLPGKLRELRFHVGVCLCSMDYLGKKGPSASPSIVKPATLDFIESHRESCLLFEDFEARLIQVQPNQVAKFGRSAHSAFKLAITLGLHVRVQAPLAAGVDRADLDEVIVPAVSEHWPRVWPVVGDLVQQDPLGLSWLAQECTCEALKLAEMGAPPSASGVAPAGSGLPRLAPAERKILEAVVKGPPQTAKKLSEAGACSHGHARTCLGRLRKLVLVRSGPDGYLPTQRALQAFRLCGVM
jgi:hypothetical protein